MNIKPLLPLLGLSLGLLACSNLQARSGEEIYTQYCTTCHTVGVAGAPKKGDADAWAPRQAKGIPAMIERAKKGLNAMPPKGLCMDCTDQELEAAIDFMLAK